LDEGLADIDSGRWSSVREVFARLEQRYLDRAVAPGPRRTGARR
jgi:hypothetical protein